MRANYGHYVGKSSAEYHRGYRERNPEQCLLASARNRARLKDIPFNITVEDIIIPDVCPILGMPLTRNIGHHGGTKSSASIDKIIPELGYVKGNIQVVSLLANNMKSNANHAELLLFATWIKDNIV
tara:strand:+ start:3372 stop:3749 length:378 start_codon:yes stop_codon:yes gene_type:complete